MIAQNSTSAIVRMHRSTCGTAAIEFALVAPLLMILLVGVVEVGFGIYETMQVQNAAEAGALYVAKHGWNSVGITAAVVNATGINGMMASPAPSQFCGCPAASGITLIGCAQVCADGNAANSYVRIDAALAHDTILSYPGLLALPMTLTGHAIVRVK